MSFQQITIAGNVGRDAEIRYTPAGVAVCDFSMAVNKVTGKGESRKEKTTWFKVVVWRDYAEAMAKHITKGKGLIIIGEVSTEAYTDKNGAAQSSLVLTADKIVFPPSDGSGARYNDGDVPPTSSEGRNGDIPF